MVATVALALGAAAVWGAADFLGGLTARTVKAATVVLWVNATGLVAAGAVVLATGATATQAGVWWALGAGLVGGVGFVVFYAALTAGSMSLVAPVTACGAIVPLAVAVAGGSPVRTHVGVGLALALGGAVLAARPSRSGGEDGRPPGLSPRAIGLAVTAALAIGGVLALLQRSTDAGGTDALAAVAVSRAAALATVALVVLAARAPRGVPGGHRAAVVAVGIGDTAANALFALASEAGNDAVAAVVSSLYPVSTVVLARTVLGERLSRAQGAGVLLALAGVALVSAR